MKIKPEWIISAIGATAAVVIAISAVKGNFLDVMDDDENPIIVYSGPDAEDIAEKLLEMGVPIDEKYADVIRAKNEEIAELTKAVEALRGTETASQKLRDEAEEQLQQGNITIADAIFAEIEQSEADKHGEHGRKAAEVARHRGAIAALDSVKDALSHYERAVSYDPEDAHAWIEIGYLHERFRNFLKAEEAFLTAQTLGKQIKDPNIMASVLSGLGGVAYKLGKLNEAEHYYNSALTLNEELGDKEGAALSLANLGFVTHSLGQLEQAEDYIRKSIAMNEKLTSANCKKCMVIGLNRLGDIATERGQLDRAEDYQNRAFALSEKLGDEKGMAAGLNGLGAIAGQRGQLDRAEDYYNRAFALSEKLGDEKGMAMKLARLGFVAHDRGKLDKAKDYLKRSIAMNEKVGTRECKECMATALDRLGLIARTQGELYKAADYYNRAFALKEDLYPNVGPMAITREKLDRIEDHLTQSSASSGEGMASSLYSLGMVAHRRGELDKAEDLFKRSEQAGAKSRVELLEDWLRNLDENNQ